ncbi:cold-responsive protein kinase 1-like [Typha angustifolia]|uniref:cold-responsive protein kinase 1-like n=1 Tax=Typha angustifolia TaxID=59011 RepID=UPI003C2F60A7
MNCFSFIFKKPLTLGHQNAQSEEDLPQIQNGKIYSYRELKNATGDFRVGNKLGQGGFGSVYKGKLKDGSVVAVKVLSSDSRQGVPEFLNELTVISNILHENLVRLHGCCVEGDHRILVYEYLENNSLALTLLGDGLNNIQFNWRTRTRICIGVARGIAFLHEEVQPPVVHRDIKASNILLDKDLNPKISDFGLAKLFPDNMTHVSTRVAGTIGYLAPEYAIQGRLTKKADTYSFGVLLLEIVSGRCNTNTRLPPEDQFLLERTWTLYERGELLTIVDTFLDDDFDTEEACRFLKVGLLCTQDAPRARPSMSTVIKMLTGESSVDVKITKPGLISDFKQLKIKNQDPNQQNTSSILSPGGSSLSSGNTTQASTFSVSGDHV